ncbi:hypothetical protein [Streptomyces sp. NPDC127066]|uniref:hypothetical protein n=1 Tax=Streptomyces sp. NPDC127066 TaxID=3347125 RepID=UPI00365BA635
MITAAVTVIAAGGVAGSETVTGSVRDTAGKPAPAESAAALIDEMADVSLDQTPTASPDRYWMVRAETVEAGTRYTSTC